MINEKISGTNIHRGIVKVLITCTRAVIDTAKQKSDPKTDSRCDLRQWGRVRHLFGTDNLDLFGEAEKNSWTTEHGHEV